MNLKVVKGEDLELEIVGSLYEGSALPKVLQSIPNLEGCAMVSPTTGELAETTWLDEEERQS